MQLLQERLQMTQTRSNMIGWTQRSAFILSQQNQIFQVESSPSFSKKSKGVCPNPGAIRRECMSWYAYCLTEHQPLLNGVRARRPFLLDGIQGVNSAPVMSYPSGEFAVIVSEFDRATSKLDEKSVLEHARVVSQSFRTATVLPFRFGTIFDTEDAIRQAVRANRRTFCESVARLRGKSEMRIKLVVRNGSLRGSMDEIVLPDTVGRE